MDVHASPIERVERNEYPARFQVRCRRPHGAEALQRYTTGLLPELLYKNWDTIAGAACVPLPCGDSDAGLQCPGLAGDVGAGPSAARRSPPAPVFPPGGPS